MAQGAIKKSAKPASSSSSLSKKSTQLKPQGSRIIKPKKAALIKQQQMKKKHSAGLTAMTEKSLAEKAGHLEMLRGGKKDAKSRRPGPSIPRSHELCDHRWENPIKILVSSEELV
ncbi:hypothetical protein H2203_006873 [Taxawa tesnikishii (nom. ined.)]|nr:hypothetical protein H2203_006873 [Dothideales sp. JES 119]